MYQYLFSSVYKFNLNICNLKFIGYINNKDIHFYDLFGKY